MSHRCRPTSPPPGDGARNWDAPDGNYVRCSLLAITLVNGNLPIMEKLISIDEVGRTVLPKAIREAANLGKGGPAKVRLASNGVIEIHAVPVANRRFKKVGKFLVAISDGSPRYDAAADVRAERDSR